MQVHQFNKLALFLIGWLSLGAMACAQDTDPQSKVQPTKEVAGSAKSMPAQQAARKQSLQRPKFSFLRFNEDWSSLQGADESQLNDPWDGLKYIPLSEEDDIWLSLGGHARLRYEGWSNFGFGGAPNNDDNLLLWRISTHADLHVGENMRAFVEAKHAYATDRDLAGGNRTLERDSLALEQAFVDYVIPLADGQSLTIRPGRTTLLFGKQRLVSPLPWSNSLRRWDGINLIWKSQNWKATGFATQFVPTNKYDHNEADRDILFWGVYATGKLPDQGIDLDLYYLGLDRTMAAFNGTAGGEERHTIGLRVNGKLADSSLDYDAEAAYQFGRVGQADINAYMFASQVGYKFKECDWSPRAFVGFDLASGDDKAGGDVETFNQLFPLGHAYMGYIDAIGRQNIMDLSLGASVNPCQGVTANLAHHFFWRESDNDAVYNAGGGVLRAAGAGSDESLGSELDFTLKYKCCAHTAWLFGYSHFFAEGYIPQSGASKDIDFVYTQVQYTF